MPDDDLDTESPRWRSQWACSECGVRPVLEEIEETEGLVCPECGHDYTEDT